MNNDHTNLAESKLPLRPRDGWIEKIKELVNAPNVFVPSGFCPSVDTIGIAPPSNLNQHDLQAADRFVSHLENTATFDQVVFRVFVVFENRNTGRFKFSHVEVRNGKLGTYHFPPAYDWERTPLICAGGVSLEKIVFP
jgi:hypothetical protein